MNIDSKLKRFIVLLDKAPFVLFFESEKDLTYAEPLSAALNKFDLDLEDMFLTTRIKPNQDLRQIIAATNKLADLIAYSIIEALANAIPGNNIYFPVHFFTKSDWQNYIEWQNVDTKPEPATNEFTIVVAKFTHEIRIFSGKEPNTAAHDGVVNLCSLNPSAPLSQALLKKCTINIHDIIVQASVGRTITAITESKYLLVMQTGHETFIYINLRRIEKDLKTVLAAFNIVIEE